METFMAMCSPRSNSRIKRVFRVGGAQAIAALAYGTESIPAVDVMLVRNIFVATAKKMLFGKSALTVSRAPVKLLFLPMIVHILILLLRIWQLRLNTTNPPLRFCYAKSAPRRSSEKRIEEALIHLPRRQLLLHH